MTPRAIFHRQHGFTTVSGGDANGAHVAEGVVMTPRAFVRVLGVKRSSFVEFSFALGDPNLCVELVLPIRAFLELRDRYGAETLTASSEDAAHAFDELMRRTVP